MDFGKLYEGLYFNLTFATYLMLWGTNNMRSEQIVAVRWPVRAWVSFCFRELYSYIHRQTLLELYSKKLFFPVGFRGGGSVEPKRNYRDDE